MRIDAPRLTSAVMLRSPKCAGGAPSRGLTTGSENSNPAVAATTGFVSGALGSLVGMGGGFIGIYLALGSLRASKQTYIDQSTPPPPPPPPPTPC